MLAPFGLVGHYPGNIEFGSRLVVVALVIAAGWATFIIAGWYAALLAAFVTSTSEFALVSTPRCDVRRIGRSADSCLCAAHEVPYKWSVYLLGFVAGYGVVVRQSGVIVVACLLMVMTGWDRFRVVAGAYCRSSASPPTTG